MRVHVESDFDPTDWMAVYKKCFYIIDEAEELIEDNLVGVSRALEGFKGLAALKDE